MMKDAMIQDIIPLTNLQKSMLFNMLLDEKSLTYFEQIRYEIQGQLDHKIFREAWNIVADENDNLRTIFRWKGCQQPLQIILLKKEVPIQLIDLTHMPESRLPEAVVEAEETEWKKKVDLSEEPIRITLCMLRNDRYEMFITTHHIIIDGWSNAIIIKEFIQAYHDLFYGYEPIRKMKPSYKYYVEWSIKQDKRSTLVYWREFLKNSQSGKIAIIKQKEKKEFAYISFRLEERLVDIIRNYSKGSSITIAALFYGVWALVHSVDNEEIDFTFGITLSGRNGQLPNIDQMAGLLIKTLPFRIKCRKKITVLEYFKKIQKQLVSLNSYCNIDLGDIINDGIIDTHFIDNVVVIQNYPLDNLLKAQDSLIFQTKFVRSLYQMDIGITLGIKMFEDFIEVDFCYCKNRLDYSEMEKIRGRLLSVIECIVVSNDWNKGKVQSIGSILDAAANKEAEVQTCPLEVALLKEINFNEIF